MTYKKKTKSLNATTHGYCVQVELLSFLHTQVDQDSCQRVRVLFQIKFLNKDALKIANN